MKTQGGKAGQLGYRIGRAWLWTARHEKRLTALLIARGLSAAGAASAVRIGKLAVVIAAAVAVFSSPALLVALIVAGAVALAAASNADLDLRPNEDEPRWRDGFGGWGLYRGGDRIDMHDPTDEQP